MTHFKPFDRVYRWEMGPYEETLKRWKKEGLPEDDDLRRICGYERLETIPVNLNLVPHFEYKDLEETAEYKIFMNWDGVKKKVRKDTPPPAMPQYLEYSLKDEDDWKKLFKPKLNPDSPSRIDPYWPERKLEYKNRQHPLGVHAGSMFGWLRNWMGIEHICMTIHDNPKWIARMMGHLTDLYCEVLGRVIFDVKLDFALMWEDMAYKTSSIISPAHVRKFMVPNYKRVTDLLRKAGIDVVMLDSDGNVEELIPIWLECGINFIYPMEVAAGMDVLKLRKQYGKDLIIGGGMDKRVMASDKKSIRKMIMEKGDMIREGGYIPGCDHAMPQDISWENFRYYRKLLEQF